jgi:hypothetical protein
MLLIGLGVSRVFAAPAPVQLAVQATSPRAGLLFTDGEAVDVRARVTGAIERVRVEYMVRETDGPWQTTGSASVTPAPDGTGEAPLPLKLPGRGLYDLALAARCKDQSATSQTSIAVVFQPAPSHPRSQWGVFYIPIAALDASHPDAPAEVARNIRLLGASWARYNFWAHTYGKVTVTEGNPPTVAADFSRAGREIAALRQEGLSILGEVAQMPQVLSSRPEATDQVGDAGPLWCRVKPRDYGLWDQLMEKLAAEFADEVQVWEILNEADIPNAYWSGTAAEFAEFVEHTSAALRRGNPRTRIAAAGFTPQSIVGGTAHARFVDEVLRLGLGKHLDLLTVHYTDQDARTVPGWRELLRQHGLKLPLWNTEERPAVPLRWLSEGDGPFFKFLHVQFTDAYDAYGPMVRKDLTLLPAGVEFSVGAHLIGTKRYVGESAGISGFRTQLFREGDESVAVITPDLQSAEGGAARLFDGATALTLAVEPAGPEATPTVTNHFGRTTALTAKEGRADVPCAKRLFVTGCRKVSVVDRRTEPGVRTSFAVEAESGRFSAGWGVSSHPGFSGGQTVDLWAENDPPDADGYWVELLLDVPVAGEYEVCFSGNSLSRLKEPRSLSPFVWRVDDGPEQALPEKIQVLPDIPGAPEGLSVLGSIRLAAGKHPFRLRLTARRQVPDQRWALWFDALGLRLRSEGK